MSRGAAADEVLVRQLYAEHGAALLAYATRLTGDRSLGEDVVRETMLRAWRELGDASRVALFTTAREVAATRRRTAGGVDPLVDVMSVLSALDELPAQERAVLYALYFQGRDVNDTAAALNLAPDTVKLRVSDALRLAARVVAGRVPAVAPVTIPEGAAG